MGGSVTSRRKMFLGAAVVLSALSLALLADSYPLDGYDYTGIRRLEAFRRVQAGELRGRVLPPGTLLDRNEVRLRLVGVNERLDITEATPRDEYLQNGLNRIFAGLEADYSVALLDISDPADPRYAGYREGRSYSPGSVGKIVVMVGLFDQLARLYPEFYDRSRVLRETPVTADRFVLTDEHVVPFYDIEANRLFYRQLRIGDVFTLWEWVDHMISPSSNAAASMVWKQVMLMDRFRRAYPVSSAKDSTYFYASSKSQLQEAAVRVINQPLWDAGISEGEIHQGSLFTGEGKRVIPRTYSSATPIGLLRFLLKLEQGQMIDRWSSLEMKRLLYVTRRRIRYAAAPALNNAAVYFKSGSLYSCVPEEGYTCGKYMGNRLNFMSSVAIIETPARGRDQRVYLVVLMSDVLRKNSAADHAELARKIDRLVRERPAEVAGNSKQ